MRPLPDRREPREETPNEIEKRQRGRITQDILYTIQERLDSMSMDELRAFGKMMKVPC